MTLVSVVVPAHQAEDHLADAVSSALGQDHEELEVVVVDDGSTDRTAAVAERLAREDDRVRVVHRSTAGGPAVARNAGLAEARGALISFLDADDAHEPGMLSRLVAHLAQNPRTDVVFSDHAVTDADLTPRRVRRRGQPDRPILEAELLCNWFQLGASLVRREVLEGIDGFDPGVVAGEDHDLWIRVATVTDRFGYVPGVAVLHRTRAGQRTGDVELKRAGFRSILRRHRHRPRRQRRLLRTGVEWSRASLEWSRGSRTRAVLALARLLVVTRRPSRLVEIRELYRYEPVSSERASRS